MKTIFFSLFILFCNHQIFSEEMKKPYASAYYTENHPQKLKEGESIFFNDLTDPRKIISHGKLFYLSQGVYQVFFNICIDSDFFKNPCRFQIFNDDLPNELFLMKVYKSDSVIHFSNMLCLNEKHNFIDLRPLQDCAIRYASIGIIKLYEPD